MGKNIFFFDYDSPPPRKGQTLSDWNRQIMAGLGCTYYIRDKLLSEIRNNTPFNNVEELKTFLREELFTNCSNKETLTELALKHFHQAGLPHATNLCLQLNNRGFPKLKDPEYRIDFIPQDDYLVIKEKNIYKKFCNEKNHTKFSPDYFLKTESRYHLDLEEIYVADVKLECASAEVKSILFKRSLLEKIKFFISSILGLQYEKKENYDFRNISKVSFST